MIGEKRIGRRAEQKRRWDDENLRGADSCVDCGSPVWKGSLRCMTHENESRSARFPEIVERWAAGESIPDIALALGATKNTICTTMVRMRRDGWDLPYRYKVENGKRVAA